MPEITRSGSILTVTAILISLAIGIIGVFLAADARNIAIRGKEDANTARMYAEGNRLHIGVRKSPKETSLTLKELEELLYPIGPKGAKAPPQSA